MKCDFYGSHAIVDFSTVDQEVLSQLMASGSGVDTSRSGSSSASTVKTASLNVLVMHIIITRWDHYFVEAQKLIPSVSSKVNRHSKL